VTGGAAAMKRKATETVNVSRVIAAVHITLSLLLWRAKGAIMKFM
jgi:hypothetical protein